MSLLEFAGWLTLATVAGRVVIWLGQWIPAELARRRNRLLAGDRLRQRLERARGAYFERLQRDLAWRGRRTFTVLRTEREDSSPDPDGVQIRSLYLSPVDGKALPRFQPGQYVTVHAQLGTETAARCYSLSDLPRPDYYRITVQGAPRRSNADSPRMASLLACELSEGAAVGLDAPRGSFQLTADPSRPAVLIAGGMGINPIAGMLRSAALRQDGRQLYAFYSVRDGRWHLMRDELERLARDSAVKLHVSYSQPRADDRLGVDYHHAGRLDIELLRQLLPGSDCEFYLCAPPPMLGSLRQGLRAWGVSEHRLHVETWGPSSVREIVQPTAASSPIEVTFSRSGKVYPWDPQATSLLDFAETHGISLGYGCRSGNCGACVTGTSGAFRYLRQPGAIPEPGTCLACIAVPSGPLVIDA